MKAAIHQKYGSPEVVFLAEVEQPVPKDDELLIKIYASTVNRTDAGFRSAEYVISRFWSGLFKPKYPILGCEFAGIVERCGHQVVGFKTGDKVFAYNDKTFGGHAAYTTIAYTDAVALIPKNIDIYEAAAITEGSHYALNIIRAANVKKGQKVLVYGATGAIGSAAVQLLAYFGADVTAVSNTKNLSLVKNLGANEVIDYEKEAFLAYTHQFDFIFDAVGKLSFHICKPILSKNGIYISTELGSYAQNVFLAMITPLLKGKKVLFPIPPALSKEDINFLATLTEEGYFKPVIDRHYTLDQIKEAYHYVATGQKTGNVILKVID
ncbi:NAD(P)-dependent alcohol dehydrogenase [Pedobacter glucosidilyticus]|uniref:NAD(P)-dependent alcohol dehydrogenase n=1 Tax=Pedobacter glucosidilyticus TaxID=1122941 RepID=UPI0026F36E9F|nr:NAD(P)-dependent alcohol dehydrogenase [Pedobacter glucosidilyticus]